MFDQRACFSVQSVFVLGESDEFVADLRAALADYSDWLPRPDRSIDERAHWILEHRENDFLEDDVNLGEHQAWAVAVNPAAESRNPLGRSVQVFTVDSLDEVLPRVDATVQTVAVAPESLKLTSRDALVRRGASRIVSPGMTNVFRAGGTHDEMYPLRGLVRLVSCELSPDRYIKGIDVIVDQPKFARENRFIEFIP